MRRVEAKIIMESVKKMCIEANIFLQPDVKGKIKDSIKTEESEIAKEILLQLKENIEIAELEDIPICQDTGMAVVFVDIGQEVHIVEGSLEDAIQEGIRKGYQEGYLRNSVVNDPFIRENTRDNTPGIIYYNIVPGEKLEISVAPKGFGSENMSRIYMLKPSDGVKGVKAAVIETVKTAGPNACPPLVVGVGIGGTFEKCALLSKKALLRNLNEFSGLPHIKMLEQELLHEINDLNIGPSGFGGRTTALSVNIEVFPTHIAGLPVAVNLCCHVNRHCKRNL